jgi:hypothetical protein
MLLRFVSTLRPDAEVCTRLVRLEMEHNDPFELDGCAVASLNKTAVMQCVVLQQSAGRLA